MNSFWSERSFNNSFWSERSFNLFFLVGTFPAIGCDNVQLPRRAPGRDENLFTAKVVVINGSSAHSFRGALPQLIENSCLIRAGISNWRNPLQKDSFGDMYPTLRFAMSCLRFAMSMYSLQHKGLEIHLPASYFRFQQASSSPQ